MKLSARLAARISKAVGISPTWLLDDAQEKMRNEHGEPWTLKDFQECQERDETPAFFLTEEEMQVSVAFGLLLRIYREARAVHAVPRFMHDLEDFIRGQVARFPHLKAQVEQENTARDKRQQFMKNYLSPVSLHVFQFARERLNEATAAFVDWESRMALKAEKVREKRLKDPKIFIAHTSATNRTKSRPQ